MVDVTSSRKLDLIVNDVAATAGGNDTLWPGGRGMFIVEATTWGGGNVKLQYKSPSVNGTYIDVDATNATFTANGMVDFELPPGELKAVRTTATGVYAYVIGTLIR